MYNDSNVIIINKLSINYHKGQKNKSASTFFRAI